MEKPIDQEPPYLFDRLLFQNDALIYQLGQLINLGRAILVIQAFLCLISGMLLVLAFLK